MRLDFFVEGRSAVTDEPIPRAIRIRQIVFEGLRSECARMGLAEGRLVRLEARTDSCLLLKLPDGTTATLDRRWARFIEIEPDGQADLHWSAEAGKRSCIPVLGR